MGIDSGWVFLTLKGMVRIDTKMSFVECERRETHTEVIFRLSANFELPEFFKTYTQEELESYIVLLGRVMLDARKDAEKRSQSKDINIIEQTIQLLNTNKKDETIKNYDSLLKEKQHIIDQLTKDKDDLSRRFDKDKDELSKRFDKDKEHFIKTKEEITSVLKARVDEKESQIVKLSQENVTLKEQMTNQTILKNNSSLKGANFEEEFTDHINSKRKWNIEDTSKEALSFDRQSQSIHTLEVAFELKGHDSKKNVPQEDVNKFIKSMQIHTNIKVAFFIAAKKAIANKTKNQFTFEITKEDQLCVYINKFSEIDENTSVDLIDSIVLMWKNVLNKLPKTESVDCKTKNIALVSSMNEAVKTFTNSLKTLDDYYKLQKTQLTEGLNVLLTSITVNSE
jgi:hypothetical protein